MGVESMIGELSLGDTYESLSRSLSRSDTQKCDSETSSSRAAQFSELVIAIPPEINPFCLSILWTLKEKGVVQSWYWEEGMLIVLADPDLLFNRSTGSDCSQSTLSRLIEASQYRETYPAPFADHFKMVDDTATDFSFLGCDVSQTFMQYA